MSALTPMTVEELGHLIPQANEVLGRAGDRYVVALAMTPGQALWLINVGLSEVRRSNPTALVDAVERLV